MRTILFMVKKEFLQVFRDRQMIPIIFIMPIFMLLVLTNAATFEIKKVNLFVVDNDKTETSRRLIKKFTSTDYFVLTGESASEREAEDYLARNKSRMILRIPHGFEKDIITLQSPKIQYIINAEDGSAAGIIYSYSQRIALDFNKDIISELAPGMASLAPTINIYDRYWYNPELDYKQYMAPGILTMLVTVVGLFLSSMNIVREKEIGTIEQLNVSPIRKHQFIIGKLLPFWLLALFELAFGLILCRLFYDMPVRGNVLLIFSLASLYLLVILSVGLFISTITETQQQAMFISWFFMVLFIMMSGLFTPIDSMPHWAQIVTHFNPVAQFVEIMRRVILKGSGFMDVQKQFLILLGLAAAMVTLSVWRYRKSTR